MRCHTLLIFLSIPVMALGRSSFRGSFRGGRPAGRSGHFGRAGLTVRSSRRTAHSGLSARFGTGRRHHGIGAPRRYPGGSGVIHGGYRYGSYSVGGYRYGGYGVGSYSVGGYGFVGGADAPVFVRPGSRGAPDVAARPAGGQSFARRLVDAGDTWFARGDLARAVAAYRQAADSAPDDPMPAFALGHGLFAAGDYTQAARHLRRGLRLFPEMVQVRFRLGDLFGSRRRFDGYVALLRRHVEAKPSDSAARFLLGYVSFFSQDYAAAKKHFTAPGAEDRDARLFLREIERQRR